MSRDVEEQLVRAARIEILAHQAQVGTRTGFVAAVMLGLMIVPAVGWWPYGVWLAAVGVGFRGRDWVVARAMRVGGHTRHTETVLAMSSVPLALVLALPAVLFMPAMSPEVRGLYSAVQVSWVAVAALVIGIHARSYAFYVLISYTLVALGWWRVAQWPQALTVSVLIGFAALVLIRFAQRLTLLFNQSVQMRHENAELVGKLTESLAETARAQQTRSRFLAAASHDLLQPVHALMLLVGVLRDGVTPSVREQAARRIEITTTAIASMFRGLLDQARLDAGAVTPRMEPVRVHTVCGGIEAAYAMLCRDKGLAFSVNCAPEVLVMADPALLDRVLRNLVDNAFKYTEQGHVEIAAQTEGDRVCVCVSDTGPGISEADRPRVFEAFFRGASANSQGVEGVGLGLAVTRQLLELMGGSIELEAAAGGGTRVRVLLAAAGEPRGHLGAEAGAGRRLVYRRVLVIEDDRQAREAVDLWLTNFGCETLCATSLAQALTLCDERLFVPEFLLSDLQLAEGPDGVTCIEVLRRRFGMLPAALITGETVDVKDVPEGVDLLRKPARPAQLALLLQGERVARRGNA